MRNRTLLLMATLLMTLPFVARAEEKPPKLVLQVIRLEPGETRQLEMLLPNGKFRPGTRDLAEVETIPPEFSDEKPVNTWLNGGDFFKVTEGIEVRWDENGFEIRASQDAKPTTQNLRLIFLSFLSGRHDAGVQVIVENKDKP